MTDGDAASGDAVALLEEFGLSAYAAATLVALLALGGGTASEIAAASEVPRTRVYDAADALHDRGLVEVTYASPRVFRPTTVGGVLQHFQRTHQERVNALGETLESLAVDDCESPDVASGSYPAWTVRGSHAVATRVESLVGVADDRVYLVTTRSPPDGVLDALCTALDRGASVHVLATDRALHDSLRDTLPRDAVGDRPAGGVDGPTRLLLADDAALASASREGTEFALWARGTASPLVAALAAVVPEAVAGDALQQG